MSASLQAAGALQSQPSRFADAEPEPRIHVVPGQKTVLRRKAWPFVLLVVIIVVMTVAVPMVINTQMAQRAYAIRDQQIELAELKAEGDALEAQLLAVESPANLEEKAQALGLVPAGHIGAISLTEKTVVGGVAAE